MNKWFGDFLTLGPGVCVTLLGVEALIITVFPLQWMEYRFAKVIAIVVCFGLAAGEIVILKHDRVETARQHTEDMKAIFGRFADMQQNLAAFQSNVEATRGAPADSLKRRALDLSNEMLQFLISREVPPGWGQGGYGQVPYGGKPLDTKQYDEDTLQDYFKVFEARVTDIRDEFKAKGIVDGQLESEYAHPANTYSIRAIAERIGTLAKRLPG